MRWKASAIALSVGDIPTSSLSPTFCCRYWMIRVESLTLVPSLSTMRGSFAVGESVPSVERSWFL